MSAEQHRAAFLTFREAVHYRAGEWRRSELGGMLASLNAATSSADVSLFCVSSTPEEHRATLESALPGVHGVPIEKAARGRAAPVCAQNWQALNGVGNASYTADEFSVWENAVHSFATASFPQTPHRYPVFPQERDQCAHRGGA